MIEKDLIFEIKINYLTNKKLKDKILEFKDWTFLNKKVTNFKFLNQSHYLLANFRKYDVKDKKKILKNIFKKIRKLIRKKEKI